MLECCAPIYGGGDNKLLVPKLMPPLSHFAKVYSERTLLGMLYALSQEKRNFLHFIRDLSKLTSIPLNSSSFRVDLSASLIKVNTNISRLSVSLKLSVESTQT